MQSPPLGGRELGYAHIPPIQAGSIPAQKGKKNIEDKNVISEGEENQKCRDKEEVL